MKKPSDSLWSSDNFSKINQPKDSFQERIKELQVLFNHEFQDSISPIYGIIQLLLADTRNEFTKENRNKLEEMLNKNQEKIDKLLEEVNQKLEIIELRVKLENYLRTNTI